MATGNREEGPSALPSGTALSLMVVANLIARVTELSTLAGTGLELNGWRVLRYLAHVGTGTPTEAGTTLAMDKTTIGRAVARLEAKGVVKQRRDPADRRRSFLTVTQKGRRLLQGILPVDQAVDRSFDEALTQTEARALAPILGKLESHARVLSAAAEI